MTDQNIRDIVKDVWDGMAADLKLELEEQMRHVAYEVVQKVLRDNERKGVRAGRGLHQYDRDGQEVGWVVDQEDEDRGEREEREGLEEDDPR